MLIPSASSLARTGQSRCKTELFRRCLGVSGLALFAWHADTNFTGNSPYSVSPYSSVGRDGMDVVGQSGARVDSWPRRRSAFYRAMAWFGWAMEFAEPSIGG